MALRDHIRRLAAAVKDGLSPGQGLDPPLPPRLTEKAKQAALERERKKEEKARLWEAAQRKRASTLRGQCFFVGGSEEILGLIPGKLYTFQLDPGGVKVSPLRKASLLLNLPWQEVTDAQVEDATETRQTTRVRQHSFGGALGPVFQTMPVAESNSKKITRSYLTIQSKMGEFLFDLPGEAPQKLRGRLLATQSSWASSSDPSRDGSRL
jgi:hypothetical protein